MDKEVSDIFYKLKKNTPELSLNNGFGHCAYGSKLLYEELKKNGIKSDIIVVNKLKDNDATESMKAAISNMMLNISESDPLFGSIKTGYIKRGNRLPKNAGHAVVLINDTVLDIASEQFDLPNIYPFVDLFKLWDKVVLSDIILNNDKFSFYIKEIITKKILRSPNDVIGLEEIKPRFLEW
jgi:hypothetical protein